jgi:hypothetical protein
MIKEQNNIEMKYYPVRIEKFIFMYYITLWLYVFYWMCKNIKYLRKSNKLNKYWSWFYSFLYPFILRKILENNDFSFNKKMINKVTFILIFLWFFNIISAIVSYNIWWNIFIKYSSWSLFFITPFLFIPILKKVNKINSNNLKSFNKIYNLNYINIIGWIIIILYYIHIIFYYNPNN